MRESLYCLFFPHPSNNHRAKLLHHRFILLLISFFFFSSFFFSSSLSPISKNARVFADISIQELVNFTNQKRQESKLSPLTVNDQLVSAANKKAEDMIDKNYWAHNSPTGTTPWFFIKQSGYDYVYAGENLARGFSSSKDVVNAWMASPEHKANLLSPNFKDVGFAVKGGKLNGEETLLVVEEFGSKSIGPISSLPADSTGIKKVLGFNAFPYLNGRPNFSASVDFTISVIFIFIMLLLADIFIIHRKNVLRFVGHNLDHVFFLVAIILTISIFSMGVIL